MNQKMSIDRKKTLLNPLTLTCLLLLFTTTLVYWQTKNFDFVNYDDSVYIYNNKNIQTKFSLESLKWAFTTSYEASWQPAVWISYLIGYQLHGLNPGWHHLTNVFFHILNVLLLFLVLKQMTGAAYRSVFVASLFALHPIHAESVVWITERKDVLCAFFWILATWSYTRYVQRPHFFRYIQIIIFLCMGLMAKPMLVTLPFTLLLLDIWPLNRVRLKKSEGRSQNRDQNDEPSFSPADYHQSPVPFSFMKKNLHLIVEKIPLLIPIVLSSIITIIISQGDGAIPSLEVFPLYMRIGNALFSYISYIGKMIWPFSLAVFYPHPGFLATWKVIGAFVILTGISIGSIKAIKARPWLFVGWFWYLGTLVPVIGILQIGSFEMADRFAYIPFWGIYIIIAWGIPELLVKLHHKKPYYLITGLLFLTSLISATWIQVSYWRNSYQLFKHTLTVTKNNASAHLNMGNALLEKGDIEKARRHYVASLQIFPDSDEVHNNLGTVLMRMGKTSEAIEHHRKALQINPDSVSALNNLGNALKKAGRTDEAIECFTRALKIQPDSVELNFNLGLLLSNSGKPNEAIQYFSKALETNPSLYTAHFNMGQAFRELDKTSDAAKQFKLALQINPGYVAAHNYLGTTLFKTGELAEAALHFSEALKLNPDSDYARDSLLTIAFVYANQKKYDKSIDVFKKILAAQPQEGVYYYNIGCLYSIQNQEDESIDWLRKAVERGYNNRERMKTDKYLENIRESEGYKDILEKMAKSPPQKK